MMKTMTKQSSRGRPKNQSKKVPKLFHLDENLVGQIRQYCFDNQLTQSEFIEMAARHLFVNEAPEYVKAFLRKEKENGRYGD